MFYILKAYVVIYIFFSLYLYDQFKLDRETVENLRILMYNPHMCIL